MLVLSRRPSQKIVFPSINASIEVLRVRGNTVRFGIEAPRGVPVAREELLGVPFSAVAHWQPANDQRPAAHAIANQMHATGMALALLREQLNRGMVPEAHSTIDKLEEELKTTVAAWRQAKDTQASKPALAGRKGLVVEDNQNERELLAGFLRLAGFEVATAGDGADALDYLSGQPRPDFMLLDMIMPRCDGPATIRSIRSDPRFDGLKIFAVSGASPSQLSLTCGPQAVDRWFPKPVDPNSLVQALHHDLRPAVESV
ncbi:MAG: response regulator [Pirellulales bacterium]